MIILGPSPENYSRSIPIPDPRIVDRSWTLPNTEFDGGKLHPNITWLLQETATKRADVPLNSSHRVSKEATYHYG